MITPFQPPRTTVRAVADLQRGDTLSGFVEPDGSYSTFPDGPFVVARINDCLHEVSGVPTVEIVPTLGSRPVVYNNGCTEALVATD